MAFPSFTTTWHTCPYAAIDPEQNTALSAAGKNVFITGGNKGIGREIAIWFAKAGCSSIAITGRTAASLEETKKHLLSLERGIEVEAFAIDIADAKGIEQAFASVNAKSGPVHILVNNAGWLNDERVAVADSPLDDYWRSFEVNIKGNLIVTQAFLRPGVAVEHKATVINITSGVAHMPSFPTASAYSTSKLGFVKIMEYLQAENTDRGLRCFSMHPGTVLTDMAKKSGFPAADDIGLPAAMCVWLSSPKADFLQGRLIWANWDIEELESMKDKIVQEDLLTTGLKGWPM